LLEAEAIKLEAEAEVEAKVVKMEAKAQAVKTILLP
jgi:hypothetical protein